VKRYPIILSGLGALTAATVLVLSFAAGASVEVTSDPSGAHVVLNGRAAGSTPLRLSGVSRGHHNLLLTLPGFADHSTQFTVSLRAHLAHLFGGQPIRIHAVLSPLPPGFLRVLSEPAGAQVYLDDEWVGTTPVRLTQVAPGKHCLRLSLEGYEPWVGDVAVAAGQEVEVRAALRSRFVAYYLGRLKENPGDLVAYTELVHHLVVAGDFAAALQHIEAGLQVALAAPDTSEKHRFFDELARIYTRQYEYPLETREKTIRPQILALVEKALQKYPNSPALLRTHRQMKAH